MENLDWPVKLLLSFLLGAVLGLEREVNAKKDLRGDKTNQKIAVLGLRSFSLVAGLGSLTALIMTQFPLMAAILSGSFFVLLIMYYFFDSSFSKDSGITTELGVFFSFLIGFLISANLLPVQVVVALTVVVILLLSRKEYIKSLLEDVQKREINALISFAILAFVILPFLPNQDYSLNSLGLNQTLQNTPLNLQQISNLELINPFKLWLIVVLITGVDLLGYILERFLGQKKGWLITSLVGGFVSSTATTISIAQESKNTKSQSPLLAGAVFSNLVSFLPIAILLITLNSALFVSFFPVLITMSVVALIIGFYFLKVSTKHKKDKSQKNVNSNPQIFSLNSALRFMGIYLVVNIVSKIALEFFGNTGFLITSAIASVTGIDAVVINTAQLTNQRIDLSLGILALLIANGVNLLAKSVYSFIQGSKEFAYKFTISMVIIIISSFITAGIFSFLA